MAYASLGSVTVYVDYPCIYNNRCVIAALMSSSTMWMMGQSLADYRGLFLCRPILTCNINRTMLSLSVSH